MRASGRWFADPGLQHLHPPESKLSTDSSSATSMCLGVSHRENVVGIGHQLHARSSRYAWRLPAPRYSLARERSPD